MWHGAEQIVWWCIVPDQKHSKVVSLVDVETMALLGTAVIMVDTNSKLLGTCIGTSIPGVEFRNGVLCIEESHTAQTCKQGTEPEQHGNDTY